MKKTIFLSLIVSIFSLSCNKQPAVSFTQDQPYYMAGDVVKLTNTSQNAKSYIWQLPEGKTATTQDVEITLRSDLYYTTYEIYLTGYSKREKKSAKMKGYIEVIPAMGNVVFWKGPGCGCSDITVTANFQDVYLDGEFTSAPACSAVGAGTFYDLEVGDYTYSATDGSKTWNGNFTITKRCCINIQLN